MAKRAKKGVLIFMGATALLFLMGWLLLFVNPTLPIPKFLKAAPVAKRTVTYYEGVHTIVKEGQARHIPETTVTENWTFRPEGGFQAILEGAEAELTAERGWDLGALPKEKVARFYQRTSNTSVSLYVEKGRVQVTLAQTRFATITDRIRHLLDKT